MWRCDYCGHKNTKTIDEIKRKNKCEICKTLYYVPIGLEWEYKLNRFVFNALFERNGLTVLWALGYLFNRSMGNKLYFLPEVDFFYNENQKEEIDVLCILDGKFIVGEVKKSALGFTEDENETQKFIKKINHIKPDTALLVFEQYSKESKDHKLAEQKLADALNTIENSIPEYIKVAVIFAKTDRKFTEYPIEVPPGYGPRTNKIFDSR